MVILKNKVLLLPYLINGMHMKKWLLVVALLSATTYANAESWKTVGSTNEATLSIDTDSIQQKDATRQAWIMWNFKTPRENAGDKTFPVVNSYKNLYVIDCKNQTMRLASEIIYAKNDAQGDSRDHSDALKSSPFVKADPNSVGGIIMQYVCSFK